MSGTPGAGPDFAAPGFAPCYRHPDRSTGISCQRCKRPICGECMQPASVGFQCPRCVSNGRAGVRTPRTAFGAALKPGGGTLSKVLMGVLVAVYVISLFNDFITVALLMSNEAIWAGQFWRLVTAALVSGSLLGLLMNLLVLWLVGRTLEAQLGGWRFGLLYLLSAIGGSALLFAVGPVGGGGIGAASTIVGLLAANAVFKHHAREDIRADLGLFGILLLYSILVGYQGFGWLMLIGSLIAGALGGVALAYAPRRNQATVQGVGLLAVLAVFLGAVAARLVIG